MSTACPRRSIFDDILSALLADISVSLFSPPLSLSLLCSLPLSLFLSFRLRFLTFSRRSLLLVPPHRDVEPTIRSTTTNFDEATSARRLIRVRRVGRDDNFVNSRQSRLAADDFPRDRLNMSRGGEESLSLSLCEGKREREREQPGGRYCPVVV